MATSSIKNTFNMNKINLKKIPIGFFTIRFFLEDSFLLLLADNLFLWLFFFGSGKVFWSIMISPISSPYRKMVLLNFAIQ
jgi:hypothetical protein